MINGPAKLDQMTFCFRINIDFFALTGVYHYILQIMDGGEPSDPFDERGVEFGLRDPLTNSNLFRLTSFVAEKYEMRRVGNKDWHWPAFASPVHVRDWQHFCVSYIMSQKKVPCAPPIRAFATFVCPGRGARSLGILKVPTFLCQIKRLVVAFEVKISSSFLLVFISPN